ncbi:MAG: WXG100 family type VII secretion target [Lachnospiraceae bacterium]|nr:WXG100 family type VII secretion target [Lachnospiraceae bacterium]
MSEIKVTSAQVNQKKEHLRQMNQNFNKNLQKMDQTEQQLLTMWEGDASKAFTANYKKYRAKLNDMYTVFESYCKALEQIIKTYEKTEKHNVQIAKTKGSK